MKNATNLFFIMVICLISFTTQGQKSHPDPVQDIERVLRNVAGNIVQNTSFTIVDKETGKTFKDSKKLPLKAGYVVESPYNEWKYWNGVLNIGFMAMGEELKDDQYIDYAKQNVNFVFDHDTFFQKLYGSQNQKTGMEQKFRMSLLDDVGAMAASVLAVHEIAPQERYRKYLDSAATYILTKEKRLDDGTYARTFPSDMTVWGDDLYMSVPFLARMGALTGEQKYFDEAAEQVVLFNKHLWNPKTNLFYHAWYDDIKQNGVAHWGRCNGWIIMAQIELLDQLPANYPRRQELIELLIRQIVGLSRYQDGSGLWHQLLDRENSYLETSATAIFTYAVAKAINEGWLDSRYAYIAAQGWEGVSSKILADGQVEGICMGTGISTATFYYANRPTPLNDIHGLGATLLAGCEVIKLYRSGIEFNW
ncbi:glycoside hydrolase family 88 protein [Cytophaga sp. FL35]|uniref:glycoside hydrolase family 88/105 protein n=1 Tax=Cytophaga sp. FL35 TaxID=1904456 RepID=UPI0016538C72|nr:glycoside hydrolase family 88 protein [Cytophaga sp. FL35]MBC7000238.1 glycoside hydrolase family 88 protein [Cytophaga sp. FL35]